MPISSSPIAMRAIAITAKEGKVASGLESFPPLCGPSLKQTKSDNRLLSEYPFKHLCGEQGTSLAKDKIRIPRYSASEKNHLL